MARIDNVMKIGVITEIPPGSLIIVTGAVFNDGSDRPFLDGLADGIAEVSGHREFLVINLPHGDLSVIEEVAPELLERIKKAMKI